MDVDVSKNAVALHRAQFVVRWVDCLRAGKLSQYVTSHRGQLSLAIPPGSVNEYQLRLGRQKQVWLILIADERVGVQVKL